MAQMPNDVINEIYHDGYMAGYDEGRKAAIKHGRWDDTKVAFYLKCSECGCCVRSFAGEVFLDYAQEWKYCPNCGAKMDGDGET